MPGRLRTWLVAIAAGGSLVTGCTSDSNDAAGAPPASSSTKQSATPTTTPKATVPDDRPQEVTVGSVAVSVPGSWVSTPNGCEDLLSRGTYLHAPGELGDATCGSVPSLGVVSTDRPLGRALIRSHLEERTIGGIRVQVGDSCPANAACIYANGLLAYLPADKVVLVVSAGSARSDAVAQGIVDSTGSSTSRN